MAMTTYIKNGAIQQSEFVIVPDGPVDISLTNQIIPLTAYLANLDELKGRDDVGVWLDSDEQVEELEGALDCSVVALNFSAFTDGRPYSSASILRRRYGFAGELRAVGDVRRDQLEQMVRCGFDAFQMAEGQDLDAALQGLKGFSENYQSTADRPEPLFRRR